MSLIQIRPFLAAVLAVALAAPVFTQPESARPAGLPPDANIIASIQRAESAMKSELTEYQPLVEAYYQKVTPNDEGIYVLDRDLYFLGRLSWKNGPHIDDLLAGGEAAGADFAEPGGGRQLLDALIEVLTPDWRQLGPDRYQYTFVRTEFLGAMRCVVYDIKPLYADAEGFTGRIYVEDRTWNIARFEGVNPRLDALLAPLRARTSTFHLDSWRVNPIKNRFVPAYTYIEEVPPLDAPDRPRVKAQIRFWAFDRTYAQPSRELVEGFVQTSSSVSEARRQQAPSPQEIERIYEQQAEDNVLYRLFIGGFLGPKGEVEPKLDQVLNNLMISNHVVLGHELHVRALLTAPLEAFSVGNTIFLSRELINVLPTEPALALVLAHQLAHYVLGHRRVDLKLAFYDVLRIPDAELLAKLKFTHSPAEEAAADRKTVDILDQSPYRGGMADGGLFIQAVPTYARQLSDLITPRFREHIADVQHAVGNTVMFRDTAPYNPANPSQIAAFPLGSRVIVNPWTGRMEFFQSEPLAGIAPYERKDLRVTHVLPRLEYAAGAPAQAKPAAPTPVRRPQTAPAVKRTTPSPAQPRTKDIAVIRN